jgi:hypothetical protein
MIFNDIIQKIDTHSIKALDIMFAGLQPVAVDEMVGEWRVGYLFTEGTGSKWETLIKYSPIKLYSKKFVDKDNVKAWIFRIFGIKFGVPLTSAVLRMVNFRDKVSASMIYNYLPMIDTFRKVDEKTIMGIMEVKGKVSVYFYLTRI